MFHYSETVTNLSGDALIGYFGRVIDKTTGGVVTIASDGSGTPIATVSGQTNMAATDSGGELSFYVAPGDYHLDIYAPDAVTFIKRYTDQPMGSFIGPAGADGADGADGVDGSDGAPGYLSYATYSAMSAATSTAGNTGYSYDPGGGTHTDANGATLVPNRGVFAYQTSPAGWIRMRDLPSDVTTTPNGTMQRWLTLATAAGSGASGTVQDAMVTVEQQLYATGLIDKIVRLNLRAGTSAAAARIPFVMRYGCGTTTETGTLSSFTQASGLTGFSLDTGLTFEKAGLGAYNLGLGAYVLSSPGGTPSAYMLRASDNAWGFSPLYSSGVNFAFALMSTFSASPYDKPDVSAVAGGVYTAPVLGTMTCVRDKSGLCSTYRNGIYLPQIIGNAPVSNTPLTQNLYVDTVTFASGGDWVTDALTPGEVTQLHWIIHNFNVAIGRGVTAEGL